MSSLLAPNPKGLWAYNLGSVRTYVRTYVRPSVRTVSVDSDFSEVYGSNSLKLYNWISFKLGTERKLRRANMYTHLFSVRFQKWRHGGHICFLTLMITLFWPISPKLCKIGFYLPLFAYRKSYMKFQLTRFSFTLSDLERSIQATQVFNGLYLEIYST